MGKYVSRAGEKLEGALVNFKVEVNDKICMDVGASTGGFTDCLLQNGAIKVYAVDTGYGGLDWKLRQDNRVVVKERTNILYEVGIEKEVEIAVVDTSWTRLRLAVPATSRFVISGGIILALIKPQYEAGKEVAREKGVLTEEEGKKTAERTKNELKELGFEVSEIYESPIKGEAGNSEWWVKIQH